jgi:hypothetical protein
MDNLTSKLNIQDCGLPYTLRLRGKKLGIVPTGYTELFSSSWGKRHWRQGVKV